MSHISLQDYSDLGMGQQFAGDFNQQDVGALLKAMSAGAITGRETADSLVASGAPLKVESLENTLKVLTHTAKHTPFFYKIGKKPATNTVEEYNQLVSYGNLEGGFTLEGELPEGSDSIYRRKAQHIKYLGVVGGVTHPMQLVNTSSGIANMIAQETKNKVELMTKLLEGYLPFANSKIVPEHFDGFMAQHQLGSETGTLDGYFNSELVVDMRGSVLTDTAVEHASQTIIDNFGYADIIISSPRTFSNFVTKYHANKLINPVPQQVKDGVFGQRVKEIVTQNSDIETMQSNFFKFSTGKLTTQQATSSKAPAAPVADGVTPVATPDDANNKFAGFTGDYFYAVAAKNKYGESALTPISNSLVTVASGKSVDLKFAAGNGAAEPATGFCIYRSEKNPSTAIGVTTLYKLFEVSANELSTGYDGAVGGVIRDRNRFLPNTDQAMMVEWDMDQVLAWKQLAPMMKMNLAITAPIQRFMVLCYGTAMLYAPRKMVRFINIGKTIVSN